MNATDAISPAAEAVLAQALQLTPSEREYVSMWLEDSIRPKPDAAAWKIELERRIQSVADGTAILLSREEAREQVRSEMKKHGFEL